METESLSIADLRKQYPHMLIMRLRGKFYNSFEDSAYALSVVTGYKLCRKSEKAMFSCGFPSEALDKVISLLKEKQIDYIVFDGAEVVSIDLFGENNCFNQIVEGFPPAMSFLNDLADETKASCKTNISKFDSEQLEEKKDSSLGNQFVLFYECVADNQSDAYLILQKKMEKEIHQGNNVVALSFQKMKEKNSNHKQYVLSGIVVYER